jgi:hypothetical protein
VAGRHPVCPMQPDPTRLRRRPRCWRCRPSTGRRSRRSAAGSSSASTASSLSDPHRTGDPT